jgi:hypothetical protein
LTRDWNIAAVAANAARALLGSVRSRYGLARRSGAPARLDLVRKAITMYATMTRPVRIDVAPRLSLTLMRPGTHTPAAQAAQPSITVAAGSYRPRPIESTVVRLRLASGSAPLGPASAMTAALITTIAPVRTTIAPVRTTIAPVRQGVLGDQPAPAPSVTTVRSEVRGTVTRPRIAVAMDVANRPKSSAASAAVQPATVATPMTMSSRRAVPQSTPADTERLVEHVLRSIDRRIAAHRERLER